LGKEGGLCVGGGVFFLWGGGGGGVSFGSIDFQVLALLDLFCG